MTQVEEVTWENELVWSYARLPYDAFLTHHDLEPMPSEPSGKTHASMINFLRFPNFLTSFRCDPHRWECADALLGAEDEG